MKYLPLIIITLLVAGCSSLTTKTAVISSDVNSIDESLHQTNVVYQDAKTAYANSTDFFTNVENSLVQRGFNKIETSKKAIEEIYSKKGINKASAYANFLQSWAGAREGYSLIRSVLKQKKGISSDYQLLIDDAHNQVIKMDVAVDEMTHSDEVDYKKLTGLIKLTSTLINAVK